MDRDFVATAAAEGFTAVSPIHGSPYLSGVDDPAYVPFATEDLIDRAHAAGLAVIPYVVDDGPTMRHLCGSGWTVSSPTAPTSCATSSRRRTVSCHRRSRADNLPGS